MLLLFNAVLLPMGSSFSVIYYSLKYLLLTHSTLMLFFRRFVSYYMLERNDGKNGTYAGCMAVARTLVVCVQNEIDGKTNNRQAVAVVV